MSVDKNQKMTMRKMGGERIMFMIPFNVVMVAKVTGKIEAKDLSVVLEKLRNRHSLLGVRVVIDENNEAWYTSEGVPGFSIETIERESGNQWIQASIEQCKISFELERGPLIRFVLLNSTERSDLILCAHHLVCDGLSLTWLIRDILVHLSEPEKEVIILPEPPEINSDTVPSPPSPGKITNSVMEFLNEKWEKKNIRFTRSDMIELHAKFWEKNNHANVIAWESTVDETTSLISRCREEKVTVNTAVWTAFLLAQYEIQGSRERYRHKAGMAVNVRDKLKIPVGEAFGFYASSLNTQLKCNPKISFWEMARIFHDRIKTALAKTNPFQMITAEFMHPTLIDSLYFSKYGLLNNKLSGKLLQKMNWDKINYGFSITNVGKVNIPKSYGKLQLESVYGPLFYSDVNEKTVGVITIGGKLTYLLSYNEDNVNADNMEKIKKRFNHHIGEAAGTSR